MRWKYRLEEFDAAVKKVIPEGLDGIENFKYEPVEAKKDGSFCCFVLIDRCKEQEEATRVRYHKVQEKTHCSPSDPLFSMMTM